MRELTQVEYHYLWSGLHRDAVRFARFLRDYNLQVSARKQIDFYHGKRGALTVTIVHRENLPGHLQDELDHYESTLAVPFVGGCNITPITSRISL